MLLNQSSTLNLRDVLHFFFVAFANGWLCTDEQSQLKGDSVRFDKRIGANEWWKYVRWWERPAFCSQSWWLLKVSRISSARGSLTDSRSRSVLCDLVGSTDIVTRIGDHQIVWNIRLSTVLTFGGYPKPNDSVWPAVWLYVAAIWQKLF